MVRLKKLILLVLAAMAVIPAAAIAGTTNSADLAVSMTENGYQVCGYPYGCQNRIPNGYDWFNITVTNNGPSTASGVQLTDSAWNSRVTFQSLSVLSGSPSCTTPKVGTLQPTVTCNVSSLKPRQSFAVHLVLKTHSIMPGKTGMTNQATVTSSTPDPNTANNTVSYSAVVS
jgi:uncharacterized repeat protein (TIGR01451 family)